MYLSKLAFPFYLDEYPGVEFLGNVIFLLFLNFQVIFFFFLVKNAIYNFYPMYCARFLLLRTLPNLNIFIFILVILTGVRWYLIAIFIFISSIINMLSIFPVPLGRLYVFFGKKMFIQVHCPFIIGCFSLMFWDVQILCQRLYQNLLKILPYLHL